MYISTNTLTQNSTWKNAARNYTKSERFSLRTDTLRVLRSCQQYKSCPQCRIDVGPTALVRPHALDSAAAAPRRTPCLARSQLMTSQWKPTNTVLIGHRSEYLCGYLWILLHRPLVLTYDFDLQSPASFYSPIHIQKAAHNFTRKAQFKNRVD